MSKFLIDKLNTFEHYDFDENNKYIFNANISDANVGEFLEIIHLLDSKFVDYHILDNFNISLLGKR